MGYKIKEARMQRGLTQTELAEKSGVSRLTIIALESGHERVTTTKTLIKLATAMNVTIDELFFSDREEA